MSSVQVSTEPDVDAPPAVDAEHAKFAKSALYIIVFVSGAVLMGVEMAGAKILAPSFGTSTFVWGSIIGMFMGALSLGYYVGGKIADQRPSFRLLSLIVVLAGIWTALIPNFGPSIATSIALADLGHIAGPLLASAALYFIPSVLMGMVSPYAVKLNADSLAGLGASTGFLYALSTFGSIVGTILTTFVLIPHLFVSTTLRSLGIALIVVAGFCLALFSMGAGRSRADRTSVGLIALAALFFIELHLIAPVEPPLASGQRLLFYEDSSYHEILVTEEVMEEEKTDGGTMLPVRLWEEEEKGPKAGWSIRRWLKFNENIESGIFPYYGEYANAVTYTDLLHLPLLWMSQPPPERVLVVGGGGGIIPTQYYNWYGAHVDVAEIDGEVERVARLYFQIPDVDKIKFHIGDGRQKMLKLPHKYDLIVLDAYSSGGQIPFHLMTWEFMEEVKSKLTDRGILITNIISAVRNPADGKTQPAALYLAEYKTLGATRAQAKTAKAGTGLADDNLPLFQQRYVFPKVYERQPLTALTATEYKNVIIVATKDEALRNSTESVAAIAALQKALEGASGLGIGAELNETLAAAKAVLEKPATEAEAMPKLEGVRTALANALLKLTPQSRAPGAPPAVGALVTAMTATQTALKPRMTVAQLETIAKNLSSGPKPILKAKNMPFNARQMLEKESFSAITTPSEEELSTVPVMTDNYAPVDTMYRPAKKDENTRTAY